MTSLANMCDLSGITTISRLYSTSLASKTLPRRRREAMAARTMIMWKILKQNFHLRLGYRALKVSLPSKLRKMRYDDCQ